MQQSGRRTVEVPADIERAVEESVVQHLQTQLAARGLLLTSDALLQANAEATRRGEALLAEFVGRCYGIQPRSDVAVSLQFQSEESRAHIHAALAFGAISAVLLTPVKSGTKQDSGRTELLCAIFNLGIGLVDGLCDEDAGIGMTLLDLLGGDKLMRCAEEPWHRGWLRMALPATPAKIAAVALAADLIECFFEELHAAYPGERSVDRRRNIGRQLAAALVAERDSIGWSPKIVEREQSLRSSRLTSVLPIQIIETLARGGIVVDERSAGTLLGEALWRIDDLVDLCQDARTGALNSVLLRALDGAQRSGEVYDPMAALKRLQGSTHIAEVAAEAAQCLSAGLQFRDGRWAAHARGAIPIFVHFIQTYAGVPPA
jgi:hypothetical protein